MSWISRGLKAVFGGAKDSAEKVPEPAASRADEHNLQNANEDRPENGDAGVDQMLEEPVALGAKRKREEDNSGAVTPGTAQKKKKSLEARRAEIRAEVEEMAESKIKSELASKGVSTEETLLFVDLVELLMETRLDPEAEEEVQEAREPSSSAASQSNGEHDQQQVESAATGSSAATAPCSRARVRPLSHCRVRPLSQHRA